MQRSSDVVVIGGGIAGTAAALASARGGARVTLVRAAPGATALCMGGWLGSMPAALGAEFKSVGHEWVEITNKLPAPDGSLRSFQFAARAQAAAGLSENTLVCGFTGLPGFRADVLARLWGESSCELRSAELTLSDTPPAGWSPASLAARIEQASADISSMLADRARAAGATTVVLPAVLGYERVAEVRAALEDSTGLTIAEALGATPTLPGWRLQAALDRMLARAGVVVEAGRVIDRRSTGARLQSVSVRTSDGAARELTAKAFVLATGKFVGGGIDANAEFRETALNCPVWIDHLGEHFDGNEPLTLTNADRGAEQPLLSAGVATDVRGAPLNPGGTPIFDNVWAAGAVRATHALGVHGLGAAAQEGWAAGEQALR